MKVLVIAACLISFSGDRGGIHHDAGDFADVTKKQAEDLARAERTLYVNRKDDPTKTAQYTASNQMIKAAEAMETEKIKAVKATEKARDA